MTMHTWQLITMQNVDVIVDPLSGKPFFSLRPGEDVGEGVGCGTCGAPMTLEFVGQPCEPIDAPAPTP